MIKLSYTKEAALEAFRGVLAHEVENKAEFSISFFDRRVEVLTLAPNYADSQNTLDSIEKLINLCNFDYCEICFN